MDMIHPNTVAMVTQIDNKTSHMKERYFISKVAGDHTKTEE